MIGDRSPLARPLAILLTAAGLFGCDDTASGVDGADAIVEVDQSAMSPDAGPDAEPDAAPTPDLGPDAAPVPDAASPVDAAPDPTPDAMPPDPLAVPLAEQSPWGPSARVHRLDVPPTPDAARRAGCLLHGDGAGSKMYSLLLLAGGGLGAQVRPDGRGQIDLVVLSRVVGWSPGQSAADLDRVDLEILPGAQDDDLEFLYRASGFVDGDPAQGAVTTFFDSTVDDGWLDTDRVTFELPISLLDSPELPLRLENTALTGRIAAEGPGFRMTRGALAGYITIGGFIELVALMREQCLVEDAPSFCNLIAGQLDQPDEALLELVIGIVGGLEARVEGPRAEPCDPELPDDCNALGICLELQAEPVIVRGIAPDQ